MAIGERIKKVRQAKSLTQQKLANIIGIKQNSIALLESGKRNPSDQTLLSICREFHVNEAWLRTGEGEMFLPEAESLLLEDASLDEFDRSLLQSYIKAPKELRAYIRKMVLDAAEKARRTSADASAGFTTEEMATYEKVKAAMEKEAFDAETAALHAELDRQREAEKRAAPASSAGSSDTASLIGRKILAASPKAQTEAIRIMEEE